MNSEASVGILGIGSYLPDTVRTNQWWPESIRAKWREKPQGIIPDKRPETLAMTEGMKRVLAAIAEGQGDPFYGAVERRVMSDEMMPSDMETRACRDALARAKVEVGEIDLLVGNSIVPDYFSTPNTCAVHQKLGLKAECLSVAIDNACNSFLHGLCLAESLIKAGKARKALLFQSCTGSAMAPPELPHSAWFGDGATAAVIGEVSQGRGILAAAHRTDGSYHGGIVAGAIGKKWYEGRVALHSRDHARAKKTILVVADNGREVVHAALNSAGLTPNDISYYACHQATCWFGRVTRDYIGLERAKHLDTFSWTGSLSSANVPLQLAVGEREGLLKAGDVVATYSGGSGITYSSVVLRWGV